MRCPFAIWSPSPNRNHRKDIISLVVVHHTDGAPNVEHAVAHLCNPDAQVSAHFVIGRAGELYQLVDTDDAAWHDSGRNHCSIGIEHVARTPHEFDRKWPDLSGKTKLKLGASDTDESDPGLPLTEPQLEISAKLVAWLLQQFNLTIDAVVPHCSNPQSTHRDCGLSSEDGGIWPWSDYRRMIEENLNEALSCSVQSPTS